MAAKGSMQPHASTVDMDVETGKTEPADLEPQPAEDHSNALQRGEPSRTGEGYDQTPKAMQITALSGVDTSDVTHTTTFQESAFDDNTDGEGEVVRAKEGTADGQMSALRRTNGGVSHPSKREETENCEDKHGRGKGWRESAKYCVGGRHARDGATIQS